MHIVYYLQELELECIPYGNSNKTSTGFYEDYTRLPEFYDGTYKYLKSLGIEEI